MRIVDRKTFLAMPAGVVFSKYAPCVFDLWCLKGDTLAGGGDFFYSELVGVWSETAVDSSAWMSELERMAAGESIKVAALVEMRDGCFDAGQLFAVLELAELDFLRSRVSEAIPA